MQLSHTRPVVSPVFDEPNLVSAVGLVPVMGLARCAGLAELGDEHLSAPTDKGANAGLKLSSLVAGMAAGADSIEDMGLLRHGGMGKVFAGAYAPPGWGSSCAPSPSATSTRQTPSPHGSCGTWLRPPGSSADRGTPGR